MCENNPKKDAAACLIFFFLAATITLVSMLTSGCVETTAPDVQAAVPAEVYQARLKIAVAMTTPVKAEKPEVAPPAPTIEEFSTVELEPVIENKKCVLVFGFEGCPPCYRIKQETLPQVTNLDVRYIDIDKQPGVGHAFKSGGVYPQVLFIEETYQDGEWISGTIDKRFVGFVSAAQVKRYFSLNHKQNRGF